MPVAEEKRNDLVRKNTSKTKRESYGAIGNKIPEDGAGHFTQDERKTYREMLKRNSEDTGIDIFDFFDDGA